MIEEGSDSFISLYITIWLTVISGAVLLKEADNWRQRLLAVIEKRIKSPKELSPYWTPLFSVILSLVVLLSLSIGAKAVSAIVVEQLLRIQILIASTVLFVWLLLAVNSMELKIVPYRWKYALPSLLIYIVAILVGFLMAAACPSPFKELWWSPCIPLKVVR